MTKYDRTFNKVLELIDNSASRGDTPNQTIDRLLDFRNALSSVEGFANNANNKPHFDAIDCGIDAMQKVLEIGNNS